MMLYNKMKLFNLLIHDEVKRWYKAGWMDAEQGAAIITAHSPAYKRNHVLFRIGIFLLTTVIFFSSMGFLGLFINIYDNEYGLRLYVLIMAGISFFFLYFFIHQNDHFKSGVDDALLYNGLALLITAIQLSFNHVDDDFFLVLVITGLPFVIAAAILFTDRLLSVLSFAGFAALVFLLALKTGPVAKMLLPFILMAASAVVFFMVSKWKNKPALLLWKECLEHTGVAALIVFYLAGNYFVVREGSVMLMDLDVLPGSDIPFAFLFYGLTFIIPLAYVFVGLKNRNMAFLNLGLLFIAVSILSIRYYYSLLPIETALIAGGAVMLAVSWFALQYLKTPKYGITAAESKEQRNAFGLAAEALVIAQSFGKAPAQQQQQGTEFGGGEFGGGGAGGDYK